MEDFMLDYELVFAVISGKVSSAINRRMYRDLRTAGLDITPEQWSVLMFLWQQDGVTQREIADATYKDKPSITRLIDNLERQGLLYRKQDNVDRRTNKIFLTQAGQDLHKSARIATLGTMQTALEGLSKEEIEQAQYLLKKVFANIQELEASNK
ncbi:MAG: MarR family transcriptional regulator [Paludibacteraceae bacterium]|jgi:DNA-binding MarR family transcriptional regulator|nr:MarR family transcriptional regulator [Paludibacteraceae bacterium]HOI26357.1 MarR family transcriptional regulator [Paludibacteraceae bacterium]HPH62135.1 MarR family transcriptional regulator [Paludibacteraceae bacterium]